ncbi:hypothetical protein Dimus_026295 [Dionaea muscipula]
MTQTRNVEKNDVNGERGSDDGHIKTATTLSPSVMQLLLADMVNDLAEHVRAQSIHNIERLIRISTNQFHGLAKQLSVQNDSMARLFETLERSPHNICLLQLVKLTKVLSSVASKGTWMIFNDSFLQI